MVILDDHKSLLASQSATRTLPEWVEYFNNMYTKNQIYSWCYRNGYNIKKMSKKDISAIQSNNARKWHINQDYFKTWSHNMAYILGFWWADGCIYRNQMFDITQHAKDKYILKSIAKELEYEGPIIDYVDRQAARINFSCVTIYNDIVKLGGSERKSFSAVFPQVPDEFLFDFIRGFFDGDGSVYYIKRGLINSNFSSASKDFLLQLWKHLKHFGINGGSLHLCSQACYHLTFGEKDTVLLGKLMYQDNPKLYLKRKKDKFDNYI